MNTLKLERSREYQQAWRAKHREALRQYFRAYRAANLDRLRAHGAEYFQANKAKWDQRRKTEDSRRKMRARRLATKAERLAAEREWRAKNPERYSAICRRSRLKRLDAKRAGDRAWRQNNPGRYQQAIAKAKAAKPELYRAIAVAASSARRARKQSAPCERVSAERIYARDRMICHLCGGYVARADRSLDHLIPIVRGGAHAEWNLMVAHGRCNKSRGTKSVLAEESRATAERYIASKAAEGVSPE